MRCCPLSATTPAARRSGSSPRPEPSSTPALLSRGSIEQLYLCLRIGLAETFAERAEALPIIFDDVLVNFDPARAASVAEVLAETAERPPGAVLHVPSAPRASSSSAWRRKPSSCELERI